MDLTSGVSYIGAILIVAISPIALAAWVRRSYGTAWRYFGLGALVFVMVQVLARLPALAVLRVSLSWLQRPGSESLIWLGILAASAGVFEEIGRYLGYRFLLRNGRSWCSGVMYGIGHGGVEAVIVALQMAVILYVFAAYGRLDISAVQFSQQNLADIAEARRWWLPLACSFERIAMLLMHAALSLMVLQGFANRGKVWLPAAICAHSGVNFGVGLVMRRAGVIYADLLAAVLAVAAILVIHRLGRSMEGSFPPPEGTMTRTG